MRTIRIKSLVLLVMLGDLVMFLGSYLPAVWFEYSAVLKMPRIPQSIIIDIAITGGIAFILMQVYDMYRNIFYRQRADIISSIALIAFLSTAAATFVCYVVGNPLMPLRVILISLALQIVCIPAWRVGIWHVRQNKHSKQRILVVGGLEEGKEITKKILLQQGHIFDIRYIYDIEQGIGGALELLEHIDNVLICSSVNNIDGEKLTVGCMKKNKNTFMIPDMFLINVNKSRMIQVDDVPMFKVTQFGLSPEQRVLKRAFDIVVSGMALVILSPLMLITAIVVKATSEGPVFFKQDRITEGNRTFSVLKFRTMVDNAEKKTGPILAAQNDARITRVGAFMRSTRIDELPQFLNVFMGDMSVIGPRPERDFFIQQFVKETPEFEYRTVVKAGITGLAQVLGKYTTTFDDKLRYDLLYVKNYSFILDLKILMKTIKVVLTKDASAGLSMSQSFEEFMKENCCRVTYRSGYIEVNCSCRGASVASEHQDGAVAARYTI